MPESRGGVSADAVVDYLEVERIGHQRRLCMAHANIRGLGKAVADANHGFQWCLPFELN